MWSLRAEKFFFFGFSLMNLEKRKRKERLFANFFFWIEARNTKVRFENQILFFLFLTEPPTASTNFVTCQATLATSFRKLCGSTVLCQTPRIYTNTISAGGIFRRDCGEDYWSFCQVHYTQRNLHSDVKVQCL